MKLRHPTRRLKGQVAEAVAMAAYLLRGYIPAGRPRRALAQTDLLFTRGSHLVLVEVKYRPTEATAHIALHPAQLARLRAEAAALQRLYPGHAIRLDVCAVFPRWPFVCLLQNIV